MKFQEYLNESINDKGILKAIFMAGQPCAGKTYVLSKISSGDVPTRIVNTDKFWEFFAFSKGDWPDKEKTKLLTREQLVLYLNSLLPLFIDSTSANPNALIRRQGLLESLGYDTGMVFVNTTLETSLKRLELRKRKVDVDYLTQKYNEIEQLKPFYQSKFKFFEEVDNNDGDLTDAVVLKAYKEVSGFFTSPLANPLGKMIIDKMRQHNWKYLFDGIHDKAYIEKLVSIWYKK
jgi:hypothetical protein